MVIANFGLKGCSIRGNGRQDKFKGAVNDNLLVTKLVHDIEGYLFCENC